jgi:hypothetical protein
VRAQTRRGRVEDRGRWSRIRKSQWQDPGHAHCGRTREVRVRLALARRDENRVDGVVELVCSLVIGRVDLILSCLDYMATGRAVGVVVRGGGMRLEVDEYIFSTSPY